MSDTEYVAKSNRLIEAKHRLSLNEQRVILMAVAKIERTQRLGDNLWFSISVDEFAETARVRRDSAYVAIREAVDKLWRREVTINGRPNGESRPGDCTTVRWIQGKHYRAGEGVVEIELGTTLAPYIVELQREFKPYRLEYVAPMKSRYGPRLYELLMQWRSKKTRTVSVEWVRETWGVSHTRTDNLRRRVIRPAVEDVNRWSDLHVEAEFVRTGRQITHIRFAFESQRDAAVREAERREQERREREQAATAARIDGLRQAAVGGGDKRRKPQVAESG